MPILAEQTGPRFRLLERLIARGEEFYVQNDRGQPAFKVDAKACGAHNAVCFEDLAGNELCQIQCQIARVRDTARISGPDGEHLATIRRRMITPLRDRFTVEIAGGPSLAVQGNVAAHEFQITGSAGKVAEVSRRWFYVRNSYGVEVASRQDVVVLLAAVVAIDQMIWNFCQTDVTKVVTW